MMKKIFLLSLSVICIQYFSFDQETIGVKLVNAFFTVSAPGNIPAETENAADNLITKRFFVLETPAGKALIIKDITIQGTDYKVSNVEMLPNNYKVGKMYNSDKNITVTTSGAGKQLWKVSFEPKSGRFMQQSLKEYKIKGTIANKSFKIDYPEDMQLEGPMYY